jgi:type 1 glutamine amidotransferase
LLKGRSARIALPAPQGKTRHPFSKHFTRIDDPSSPINAAFKGQGFEFSDEMYTFKAPYSREKLHILLSIDVAKSNWPDDPARPGFKKGENRPDHDYAISWIHRFGQGRVFYCSYGHNPRIFSTPTVLQHYLAGLQYALGDLKADDTPSAGK